KPLVSKLRSLSGEFALIVYTFNHIAICVGVDIDIFKVVGECTIPFRFNVCLMKVIHRRYEFSPTIGVAVAICEKQEKQYQQQYSSKKNSEKHFDFFLHNKQAA
ncbi:MAG TPA: hypothetical protein VF437_11980, partial [Verrucomicrobiae bacterium]